MQQLVDQLLAAIQPMLTELVTAAVAAAIFWLRAQLHKRIAVGATEEAELWAHGAGEKQAGQAKKVRAKAAVMALPPFVRPLSEKGLDRVVEKAVPKGRERARAKIRVSEAPPEVG